MKKEYLLYLGSKGIKYIAIQLFDFGLGIDEDLEIFCLTELDEEEKSTYWKKIYTNKILFSDHRSCRSSEKGEVK